MCKAKKWLATLGAILIVLFSTALLWAGPPGELDPRKPLDEGSWNGYCGSGSGTAQPPKETYNYYLLRFSPVGGFYLIRVSSPVAKASAPTAQKPVKY